MISQQKLLIILNKSIKTKHGKFTLRFKILASRSNKAERYFAKCFVDKKAISAVYSTFFPMQGTDAMLLTYYMLLSDLIG